MIGLVMAILCSVPGVHPATTERLIEIESRGDELALFVNGPGGGPVHVKNHEDAARRAAALIAKGKSVDLGLMQVNSKNLERLGLSAWDAFDPCKNVRAGTEILKESYDRAEAVLGGGQKALRAAVSAYNTGNFRSGVENGYVDHFYGKARRYGGPFTADTLATFDFADEESGFHSSRAAFQKRAPLPLPAER